MQFRCLLFDLDGTLVDSRADLITSVNLMLEEIGRRALTDLQVIGFIGEGARLLVERSLRASAGGDPLETEIDEALEIFKRQYGRHLLDQTRPYPEVKSTLNSLAHLPKAIVTNKPFEFTQALLDGVGLSQYFSVIFGGDSLPERKPSPMMLLEAAKACGAPSSECLMIGDSRVDVEAGKAAGMKTCGFIPGFRGRTELAQAGADYMIERFGELPLLLEGL
jgi:phosphoglycolate phosphatase